MAQKEARPNNKQNETSKMKTIQEHWQKSLVYGFPSILYKNGDVQFITINNKANPNLPQTFNLEYELVFLERTNLETELKKYDDVWSEFQAYGTVERSNGTILKYGEGAMGNEGFIAKLNTNNELEWILFSTCSNPFIEHESIEDALHIFSSHGFSMVVTDDSNPTKLYINN